MVSSLDERISNLTSEVARNGFYYGGIGPHPIGSLVLLQPLSMRTCGLIAPPNPREVCLTQHYSDHNNVVWG